MKINLIYNAIIKLFNLIDYGYTGRCEAKKILEKYSNIIEK